MFPFALAALLAAGCDNASPDTQSAEQPRVPLGKADAAPSGSCEDACGGPSSDGPCWCDDLCVTYGDCCLDKAAVCDAPDTAVVDAVLLLVNTAGTRFLVDEVGLELAEAQTLLAERSGVDGVDGNGDDAPFASLVDITERAGFDTVALEALTAFASPVPGWDEYLPQSFSITTSALRCRSGYSCSPTEPFTRGFSFTIDAEAGTIEVGGIDGVAHLEEDGRFEHSHSSNYCTDRFCYEQSSQIRGQLSPFGSVLVESFSSRSRSGNQAYGFTVNQQRITGPQRVSVAID